MRKIFALIFTIFPFVANGAEVADANTALKQAVNSRSKYAVQRAIDNGATNAHEMLGQALRFHAGYGVVGVLMDVDVETFPARDIDGFYVDYIIRACDSVTDKDAEKIIPRIGERAAWDYKLSSDGMQRLALGMARKDDVPEMAECVFSYVAKYDLGGREFIDAAQEAAEFVDALNLKTFIAQLRLEIEKIQNEKN